MRGVRSWNRGQLVVFLCAALLCEAILTWKYQDIANRNANNLQAISLALKVENMDDSTKQLLGKAIQETVSDGQRGIEYRRLILFVGGVVIPIVVLAIAWRWTSGKPRTV